MSDRPIIVMPGTPPDDIIRSAENYVQTQGGAVFMGRGPRVRRVLKSACLEIDASADMWATGKDYGNGNSALWVGRQGRGWAFWGDAPEGFEPSDDVKASSQFKAGRQVSTDGQRP